ncbi:MAG TPA: hypothetical protein VLL97_01055, partial [Acidobacteriota bacterium]|nr:hypothetical protein [Acidobacteriota bacterium]
MGNLTRYGSYTLGYDAESRNTTVTGTMDGSGTFLYDGEGRRVKKTWTQGGITRTTWYFYNALGQLAAEYSDRPPTNTGTSWLFTDMLGSVRAITNESGNVVEFYDYLPFGRMLSSSDNGRNIGGHPHAPDLSVSSRAP